MVSIGFGELQKCLKSAEQYAEQPRVKSLNRLKYQGFSAFGIEWMGIKLEKGSIMAPYTEVLLSWKVVEKRIRKLIAEDKYLSPEGKEAYAENHK